MSLDATRAPGRKLTERYTLTRILGRGGMATVWEAVNEAKQKVAVKLLHSELTENQDNVSRFFLEARNATRIAHPGIVRVLDTGQTDDGAPFLVMEYLEGLSLETFLQRNGPLTPAQAASVLVPMFDALAAAHAAGVIHRDLKPGNVFIALGPTPGVKLLDFGISRAVTHETRLTQTGASFGTPAYMAPEQVQGTRDAGAPADLYSCGAIAFELVTGRTPYTASSALALAALVVAQPPPPLASVKPGLPPAFSALVDRALARDQAQRPADALAFKRALLAAVTPDLQWLFERASQLMRAAPPKSDDDAPAPRVGTPRQPIGAETTLAVLQDRLRATDRQLPPAIAVRLVSDLLLDPSSPPVFGPSHVRVASNGVVRALPGVPKRVRFTQTMQTTVPPEAWDGAPGALSSQFSAGAMLVQLLTGQAPFEAADEKTLLQAARAGIPDELVAKVPPPLRATVQRMTAADPLRRFPDAGSCANELVAPYKTAPLFSRATEELAALLRVTSQVEPRPAPPPVETAAAPSPMRPVALLVIGACLVVGVLVYRGRTQQVLVEREDGSFELMSADAFDASVRAEEGVALTSDFTVQTSPPGAALWLDGEFRGNAPGTLTLQGAQDATLHLELPGHLAKDVPLKVDGKPHPLTLRLEPKPGAKLAWANFELPDDATLWLDNFLVAKGRVRLPLEAGVEHTWEVERAGQRSEPRTVTLEPGTETTLK